ncbi:MAG: glycerate kinase type-2 family protein [Alphaproteobacteria bacterium]
MTAIREDLRHAFDAAVAAAHPSRILTQHLPPRPAGQAYVFAVGKAAVPMAEAVEAAWGSEGLNGLVVAPHGSAAASNLTALPVATASHPYPDERGAVSASRLLAAVAAVPAGAPVLFLLSGGASSLLLAVEDGPAPEVLQAGTRALLNGGADIHALNTVRRALSPLLGGGLAQACPGQVSTLAISDVVGDNPVSIGSGPTVQNPTGAAEALELLDRYDALSARLEDWLRAQPPVQAFEADYRIIASGPLSLQAAEQALLARGHDASITADAQVGLADDNALMLAERVRRRPAGRAQVWLMGGEVDVRVTGSGRGGRNVQFAARLAQALDGVPGWTFLAADTDGQDGNAPNAGAFCDSTSWARARAAGLDPDAMLAANDAHSLFEALGDALITGPTGTNVNDFRALALV